MILSATLLANLPMDVAQPGIGVVVEVLAVDEGRDQVHQLFTTVSRQRSRLEPCIAFPGSSLGDEVMLECCEGR